MAVFLFDCYNIAMKKIIIVFIFSFALNLIWENLHSFLYLNYRGGEISQLILLRATLFDAIMITAMYVVFLNIKYFKDRLWWSLIFGFIISLIIELYAKHADRWSYNSLMPIVPFLNLGLTPLIQLGLISYVVFKFISLRERSY